MGFITTTDTAAIIKSDVLTAILDGDATAFDAAVSQAQQVISGYLSNRYDLPTIFSKTGTDRHPLIVNLMVDITTYRLHQRINPRQIPDIRKVAYDEAIHLLERCQKGIFTPDDLPTKIDPVNMPESGSRFGSNPPFRVRW